MSRNFKLKILYEENGNVRIADGSNDDLIVEADFSATRARMSVTARKRVKLLAVEMSFPYAFSPDCRIFCNGYQSWTTSREFAPSETQKGLRGVCKFAPLRRLAAACGDYSFVKYHKISGLFHAFGYGYVREGDRYLLVGSTDESHGYTIINFEPYRDRIKLYKDVEGLILDGETRYEAFDVVLEEGNEDAVFDAYFRAAGIASPRVKRLCGYTSWYNYFGNISEEILLRDLEGLDRAQLGAQIFQIDDGYQTRVGDWLSVKECFPHGMKYLADAVHRKGMMAGLWLAPFLCAKNSLLAERHPDWLLTDERTGRPLLGAIAWGGAYALDSDLPEVRDYLREVFRVVFDEWGFDMVKLDFLYAGAMTMRNNKTRGQLMCEALDFFRELAGEKLILGCGVPLAPAFGRVDLCRVGCDVHLRYKDPFYNGSVNQEIISAHNAILNTLYRRQLGGRAFANDPDVFFARKENLRFSAEQKALLARINAMCGDVLFISDNAGDYDEAQKETVRAAFACTDRAIGVERCDRRIFTVRYITQTGETKELRFDWKAGKILFDGLVKE